MEDPIAERLIHMIRANIPNDNHKFFTLDDRLDMLGIDSLGMIETIFEIEDEFGIEIPQPDQLEETVELFQTVNDLVQAVKELIAHEGEV